MSSAAVVPARRERVTFDRARYVEPRPDPRVSALAAAVNRWVFLDGVPWLGLRGRQGIARLDIPHADASRLEESTRAGHATYLAPNHPEYLTDWVIDKALVARFAPDAALWADHAIVNLHPWTQRLFLANNVIANVRGGEGRATSVRWASFGRAVLLHPEGHVGWTNDHVQPLLPGLASMALATRRELDGLGREREVRVQPVVWKLAFTGDVSRGLARELGRLERALGLPRNPDLPLASRFFELQKNLLMSRELAFGVPVGRREDYVGPRFFDRQEALAERLFRQLCARHGTPPGDRYLQVERLRRAVRALPESQRGGDLRAVAELGRCQGFSRAVYGGDHLTQEQLAESLKRTRQQTVRRTWRDHLEALLPRPVGPRVAHVRVPEAIVVRGSETEVSLTADLRRAMQGAIDGCLGDLREELGLHAMANPFALDRQRG